MPNLIDLTGKKFSRLLCLKYFAGTRGVSGKYECLCDCGKIVKIVAADIRSGHTKSCGCFKIDYDKSFERVLKLISPNVKYSPMISSARELWKIYKDDHTYDITFEDFYDLTQKDCTYCGISPNKIHNHLKRRGDRNALNRKGKADFLFNGLDRVDSNRKHILNNVVTCCLACNKAKLNNSLDTFYAHIKNFTINFFNSPKIVQLPTINITGFNRIYKNYLKIDPLMTLTDEEFYAYSQESCFYCNKSKDISNNRNGFRYNGLDRVNSNLPHIIGNVVPACAFCNLAKGKKSLFEFQEWMMRIKGFLLPRLSEWYNLNKENINSGYYELDEV